MFKKILIIILLVTSYSLLVTKCNAEEQITITTYYPSPYGSYRELRSQRMAIGDDYVNAGDYTWEELDGDGGEIDYQADLVVQGNVGIGMTSPSQKLDVDGSINIAEGKAYMYGGQQALRLANGTDDVYANTFVGAWAGNATASRQTVVGYLAGNINTGASQTAVGYRAGHVNTEPWQTALGAWAGYYNEGQFQTAVGSSAGRDNTGASQTALGSSAGRENTGVYQVAIGYLAGYQNIGAFQTAIGTYAGRNNSGTNVVAIGFQAGKDNTLSNQFIIQQANVNAVPLIQGDFSSGSVGIGTASPASGYMLDVQGKIQATAFDVGDITFRDQETQQILWRMFEDEDGLYLENNKTGKVYRFVLQEVKK